VPVITPGDDVLSLLPADVRAAFVEEWRPAYEAANRWESNIAVGRS
jgi:hypothetical protein